MARVNMIVEDDIPRKLIALAGSRRNMGQYLTALVRQLHDGDAADVQKFVTALDTLQTILDSARSNAERGQL